MKRKIIPAVLLAVFLLAAKSQAPAVWLTGFLGPENLIFDKTGTLFITDTNNLWKVTPDKKMEKLYTRDSKLDGTSLCGVVLAREGAIYFSASSRILKLAADGKISEYAKGFKLANGLAIDEDGNLYTCDSNAREIMAITPDGKIKTLVKGEGSVNGLKYQQSTKRLYFTSMLSGKVEYVQLKPGPEAGEPVLVADLGTGLDDMALAPNGDLYVCQYLRGKIFKVTADGQKELIAEGIKGPSSAAFGVTSADKDTLYILEKGANLKFNGTSVLTLNLK